jgi:hypothetical protein
MLLPPTGRHEAKMVDYKKRRDKWKESEWEWGLSIKFAQYSMK